MKILLRSTGLFCILFLLLTSQALASGEREAAIKAKNAFSQYLAQYKRFVTDGKKQYSKELKTYKEYKDTYAWLKKHQSEKNNAVARLKAMKKQGKSNSALKKTSEYSTYFDYRTHYNKYKELRADYKKSYPQLKKFFSEYKEKNKKYKVLKADYYKKLAAYKSAKGGTSQSSSSGKFGPRLSISPQNGKIGDNFTFTVRGSSSADSAIKRVYMKFDDYPKEFVMRRVGSGKYSYSKSLSGAGNRGVTAYVEFKSGGKKEVSGKVNLFVRENVVDLSRLSGARNADISPTCFTVPLSSSYDAWLKQGKPVTTTETFLGVPAQIGPIRKHPDYNTVYSIARRLGQWDSDKFECVGLIKQFMNKIYKMPIQSMGNGAFVAEGLAKRTGTYNSKRVKFTYHGEGYAFAPPVIGSVVSEALRKGDKVGHVSIVKKIVVERKDSNGSPTKFKAYLFEQNNSTGSSAGAGKGKVCPEQDRYLTFDLRNNKWHATGKWIVVGWANAVYM